MTLHGTVASTDIRLRLMPSDIELETAPGDVFAA
jgi:hypothetical protein